MTIHYQYAVDIVAEDGRRVGQATVVPDWKPALEWVYFQGIREGRLPAVTAAAFGTVEPIWHPQSGQPYVSGFRAVIPSNGNAEVSRVIPTAYLRALARQTSASLVEKGLLKAGEVFRYAVSAFGTPMGSMPQPANAGGFSVEEIAQPLPLDEAPLDSFFRGSLLAGGDEADGDTPVFMRRSVLDEAMELARRAGDIETGGVLVGKLYRDRTARDVSVGDASACEIFVEVTAQIPAPHTLSQSTRLTFTAETWAAVRAALALRKRDELMLGWWHSHPDFCRLCNCPVERRRYCTAASPFLSAEDVHLHATCFPCAYQMALLISDSTADGMTSSLFGWWQGMVRVRAFHILGGTPGTSVDCPGPQEQGPPSIPPDEVSRSTNAARGGRHGTHATH